MAQDNTTEVHQNGTAIAIEEKHSIYPNMESVNRLTQLPVVESTWNFASNIYGKVKNSNSLVDWTLTRAENTVSGVAGHVVPPLTSRLEGPLKKVDSAICSGMDYVEAKVPAVKLPPSEMYANTKDIVSATLQPAIRTVTTLGELSALKVSEMLRRNGPDETVCCDMPCCYGTAKGERCCRHRNLDENNTKQCVMPLAGVKECSSCTAKALIRRKSLLSQTIPE